MCVKDRQNTSRGANCLDRESRKKTMMSKGRVPLPRTNRRMETDIGERVLKMSSMFQREWILFNSSFPCQCELESI